MGLKSKYILANLMIFTFILLSCEMQKEGLIISEPELISDGYQFTEGPYWHPDGFLLFSDIPANRVYKWHPDEGASIYIEPSGNSNGISADINGNLILAQHAGRVSRVGENLELEVIADNYNGMRLNSPNDLAVHTNGNVYFTDPPFGVSDEDQELDFSGVYKLTPEGDLTFIYDRFTHPNGIVFSPDETKLYVNDSRTGEIIVFDVDENGNTSNPVTFANLGEWGEKGAADGMKVDVNGNLYTTGPNGLVVFDSEGNEIKRIEFEEQITNLAWGGPELKHLFLTATSNVYRFEVNIRGDKKV
ncbi:MAG: SMP-30/gluconolactonase/LRE family protein [Balneolaceae bacterium]